MTWWALRGRADGEGSDVGGPRRIGESLGLTTARLGGPETGTVSAVFAHWEALVGPEVAAHARPQRLRDGVLVVEVDQPAWATQLRFLSGDLLARVRGMTGGDEVREVQVRMARSAPA